MVCSSVCIRMLMLKHEASSAELKNATRIQIGRIHSCLLKYKSIHGAYPLVAEFSAALLSNGCGNLLQNGVTVVDPWGTPIRYHIEGGIPSVTSAGPDQKFDTEDDVNDSTQYP